MIPAAFTKFTRVPNAVHPFLLLAALCLGAGCSATQPRLSTAPVDFQYTMQGNGYALSQLRGTPVLLVLVRTSEVTNEMHLDQIQKIQPRLRNRAHLLVLSIAPNEAPMLDMFVEFNDYPFFIGVADWSVAEGQSSLGVIPDVPTTYLIGGDGALLDVLPGAAAGEKILGMLRARHIIP